jgi:hypothetical protein
MILDPDFREFIKFLSNHEVRYLIVGGYAVAFHGYPRYTKELTSGLMLSRTMWKGCCKLSMILASQMSVSKQKIF